MKCYSCGRDVVIPYYDGLRIITHYYDDRIEKTVECKHCHGSIMKKPLIIIPLPKEMAISLSNTPRA